VEFHWKEMIGQNLLKESNSPSKISWQRDTQLCTHTSRKLFNKNYNLYSNVICCTCLQYTHTTLHCDLLITITSISISINILFILLILATNKRRIERESKILIKAVNYLDTYISNLIPHLFPNSYTRSGKVKRFW